jgi:putative peptide zinc metalloprotease protein
VAGSGGGPNKSPLRRLREDLDLYPGPAESSGESTWILHDPVRNRFFGLGWAEFELLRRWFLKDPGGIASRVAAETTLDIEHKDVKELENFLDHNELLCVDSAEQIAQLVGKSLARKSRLSPGLLHRYLFFRIPLVNPDRFLSSTLPFVKPAFSRGFRLLLAFAVALGLYLVMRQWSAFTETLTYLFSTEGLIYFAVALIFAKCLHEFGHAYACKYYGLKVPTMGVAFLVMWPFLYTDTTESWKLVSRRKRLVIGAAGMYAELCLAAFATLLWSFLDEGPVKSAMFFLATTSWMITLLVNTNPFMRWDGYYLLADFLGIQNLQDRAFALGRWRLRELLFGLGEQPPEYFAPRRRHLLTVYAFATWLYRFVLFLGIALLVYHFFFKLAGIALMLAEVGWFVGMPIYRELKEWYDRRHTMRWNKHTLTTFAIVIGLLSLLVTPWQRHVTAPALLAPDLHKTLYPPAPGRVIESNMEPGQIVKEGDLLMALTAPELDYELKRTHIQIGIHRANLDRLGTQEILDARQVVQKKLQEAISAYRGYRQQIDQLQISSPFDGEVIWVEDALNPGRWVSHDTALATLVDKGSIEVHAYVTEDQLARIDQEGPATFYPEDPGVEGVLLRIKEVDTASTASFDDSPLASTYGGDIAVREGPKGELIPQTAVYRVTLGMDDAELGRMSFRIVRGTVHLPGGRQSIISQIWTKVISVLIRESGF